MVGANYPQLVNNRSRIQHYDPKASKSTLLLGGNYELIYMAKLVLPIRMNVKALLERSILHVPPYRIPNLGIHDYPRSTLLPGRGT